MIKKPPPEIEWNVSDMEITSLPQKRQRYVQMKEKYLGKKLRKNDYLILIIIIS